MKIFFLRKRKSFLQHDIAFQEKHKHLYMHTTYGMYSLTHALSHSQT